ncbi:hypothetical protein U9M48_027025 [Paspalum notatum var. saurae]|uniref:Uncharacterized protein n=1 Tax=Paspalum notatum var. saurae TaxID=547442 RepID=A0AAQ3TVQ0_PASNO
MDVGGSGGGGGGGGGGVISSPGTEEDKFARRRSRRVSFADTTAVHVFDRDEDFETPPEEREPGSASPSPSPGRNSAGREDGDDTEEDFPRPPVIFLPDVESSSPGSADGSIASSIGDEHFFGPVSASFLQTGRPSDSGMSEDGNHDITLDSRTFSLHFRNIAPPDDCTANSAASLTTPNMASKGLVKELTASDPGRTSSSGRDALTDMSLLTGNPRSYAYGQLSPTLDSMMQKIKGGQQTNSPEPGFADATPDRVLAFSASEKENMEEKLCIGDVLSSGKLGIVSTTVEQGSMGNSVSTSTDLIQEDNEMIINGHDNSQNCNHNRVVVDPGVNNTVGPFAMFSPVYKSFMSNDDVQSHLLPQSLSKDQPSGSNCTTSASYMCDVDMESNLLDKPPGTNNAGASQLPSATLDICLMDAENPHRQNEVMDTETILHTPRTVGLQLQVPQGSISSLRSKRLKLFSSTPLSNSTVASQVACYFGSEFAELAKSTSALKNSLKTRLQASPAASRLPLVEKNERGHQANNMFSNTEDHDPTLSVSSNPVSKLKKTSDSFILGTQRQGLNEATKVQDQSSPMIKENQNGAHEGIVKESGHAVQESPDETAKAIKSPRKSRKDLSCVPQSSIVIKENQNRAHDNGHSANVDWNKLDMLSDKLDEVHMARKYKRLSTAVRVKNACGDKQNRLEEARSLHDKLFYEKAKLQINNMKLSKLKNKAQLYRDGIQECCFLKSKILGAAQTKDASLPAATSIDSSNRQEEPAVVTEKRLELSNIQQKMEKLRSSLECFRNIEADISFDNVMRCAEEQLKMRDQLRIIHQQTMPCEVSGIVKRDNKRDVILNYRNLLFQRIILNTSDASSLFVNNSLNGTKIGQTFPNLDASVAFNFLFKAEENHRVSDLQSLQMKIMETSFLLGQLGLRLCFMSFKSGKKIAFIIDMTDLNRSVYPSDPSELPVKICKAQTTVSKPSIDETLTTIRNMQPGRTVILRLCRMVSVLTRSL